MQTKQYNPKQKQRDTSPTQHLISPPQPEQGIEHMPTVAQMYQRIPTGTQLRNAPPATLLHLQHTIGNRAVQRLLAGTGPSNTQPPERKAHRTGLPDALKAGVERLSGLSLDDVNVHYNSSQPAQVDALAYTQGTDIHMGPGQERHLAHEAWHVVQQKQGRVQPMLQMKGVKINDDEELEREADVMGERGRSQTEKRPEAILHRSGARQAEISSELQDMTGVYANTAAIYSPVMQCKIIIHPSHYSQGLRYTELTDMSVPDWIEYWRIAVEDEWRYATAMAPTDDKKNTLESLAKNLKEYVLSLNSAKDISEKVPIVINIDKTLNELINLVNTIEESSKAKAIKDTPSFLEGANRYSVAAEKRSYKHKPLSDGREKPWESDEEMHRALAPLMGMKTLEEVRPRGHGEELKPLMQIPWELAKRYLPRPLINLIFDIYFQLWNKELATPVDERTEHQRASRNVTPHTPGSLRSYHTDAYKVLPATDLSQSRPGTGSLEEHYTKTSKEGTGSSQAGSSAATPIGYAEYTGTGSNTEHSTKIVLDYRQGRVYLTFTHYQYPISWKDTEGNFNLTNSRSQEYSQAELEAEKLKIEKKATDIKILSPWVEIIMH